MQQSEFEKRVREKMDELNFTPSPPVWPHIEKQIRQKKDRRRLLAWIFLLALALGGGTWWMLETMTDKGQPVTEGKIREKVEGSEVKGDKVEGDKVKGDKVKGNEVEGGEIEGRTENIVTTDVEEKNTVVKENEVKSRTTTEKEKVTRGRYEDGSETMAKVPAAKNRKTVTRDTEPQGEAALNTGRKNTKPATEKIKQDKPAADTQSVVMTPPAELPAKPLEEENKKEETTKETETGTAKETATAKETQKETTTQEPSADTAVAVQSSNRQQKTSKWTKGISVTVGVSGMGEGLQLFPRGLTMDNLYNSPSTGGGSGVAPLPPSRVGNGFSFGAGYTIKRNTGKRLSYSTGLRYNYYSTSIAIGTRHLGDTSIPRNTWGYVTVGVFYSNALASASFDARRIYRNQYHFVSVPFDLEMKLGDIPLYATTGLSLQYMVATNALVYSPRSYVYYKDKEALNRLQLFGNIGLHYTFFQKKKTPVQVGPQLGYGLGRLEKQNRSNLFTAGITARMALGKKRI
jgi:hypothetical protein